LRRLAVDGQAREEPGPYISKALIIQEWCVSGSPPEWVEIRPVAPKVVAAITDDLDVGE
jgi:hypothetical protein